MLQEQLDSLAIFSFNSFKTFPNLVHFVSTRIGGFSSRPYNSLNLGLHVRDDPNNVLQNRDLLAKELKIPLLNFTIAKQIHEGNVQVIEEELRGCGATNYEEGIAATDAMVTRVPNICLMVLLADCVPILFFDPTKTVIGVAHAGWRGTLRMVAQNTVKALGEVFGCSPKDIIVGVGPSIGPCCYQVGEDVVSKVEKFFPNTKGHIVISTKTEFLFDLWAANRIQLLEMGIPETNIEIAQICTYCNSDLFFSERHQKGMTGRFGVGIMIRI